MCSLLREFVFFFQENCPPRMSKCPLFWSLLQIWTKDNKLESAVDPDEGNQQQILRSTYNQPVHEAGLIEGPEWEKSDFLL